MIEDEVITVPEIEVVGEELAQPVVEATESVAAEEVAGAPAGDPTEALVCDSCQ